MADLDVCLKTMLDKYASLLSYFGEDSGMGCHEFFATLNGFVKEFVSKSCLRRPRTCLFTSLAHQSILAALLFSCLLLFAADTREVVERLKRAEEQKKRMEAAAAKKAAEAAAGISAASGADKTAAGPRPAPIALPTLNASLPAGSPPGSGNAKAKRRGSAFV